MNTAIKMEFDLDSAFFYSKEIRKVTKVALIDYQYNPAFISFHVLSASIAAGCVKKLIKEGYNAIILDFDKRYIKVLTLSN